MRRNQRCNGPYLALIEKCRIKLPQLVSFTGIQAGLSDAHGESAVQPTVETYAPQPTADQVELVRNSCQQDDPPGTIYSLIPTLFDEKLCTPPEEIEEFFLLVCRPKCNELIFEISGEEKTMLDSLIEEYKDLFPSIIPPESIWYQDRSHQH